MLQKKICMVGVFGTGKTCLVQRYVHSLFSVKYLSTVGVKIDRKEVRVGSQTVSLLLWDLEGRDQHHDINPSYLRGAHGLIYVVDGTRRETLDQLSELRELATRTLGDVPSVVALNKVDLADQWQLDPADESALAAAGQHRVRTSAKTGEGVEATFHWLAEAALGARSA
ncbi:MAG TPA: Rab family GTPase [Gemmatimonadaceae bacterium]|nr:Rab family GTPase [Gemmatimonadaceae bacterium]